MLLDTRVHVSGKVEVESFESGTEVIGEFLVTNIFLSHSHADREFARKLASDLRLSGIHVWIDEAEIKIGESLLSKIQSGIMEMNYLAVILSRNSVTSNWVTLELQMAMSLEMDN